MNLIGLFQDDRRLSEFFRWLTRISAGVKFSSRPIGWYQMHQCKCIDKLRELLDAQGESNHSIRCHDGMIQVNSSHSSSANWVNLISANDLFAYADREVRR